jgi:hypothetical protein
MFYRRWVGLPWEWGADPRDGKAACCFRTAQAAREELGLPWPSDRMDDWYSRARRGAWIGLKDDWDAFTERIEKPVTGALLRFDNTNGTFGLGVLAEDEIVITVRHQGRLLVAPLRALGPVSLYQLK